MPVNVALDIFVVIPRSDTRESDLGPLCVFAEREIVEDNGDFDDSESGGSAAAIVARRVMRERRSEGVSFIVAWREKQSSLLHSLLYNECSLLKVILLVANLQICIMIRIERKTA
jgi:hypothetical protein